MTTTKAKKKRLWQCLLVMGLICELAMISIFTVSMIKGFYRTSVWQSILFLAIGIWIYIAYLKQRHMDVSKFAVDEKIKTHAPVSYTHLTLPTNREV